MARILVVEDEQDLQQVLAYNLKQAGHDAVVTKLGAEGLRLAREQRPDLVLLDLMLPDVPGTEVCKQLKESPATRGVPVMMLTAKGEEIDRVVGFELGADDYVVKPFSVRELLLRIQAILRRGKGESTEGEPNVEFGRLRIDRGAHRTWVDGVEIELTALEFKLLVTLYDRRNRVQTRTVLLDDVWGIQADITTRTVDTHVKRLREKLEGARDYVETVRGVGYRFVSAPEEAIPT
jgi:two-component system, OmpR family, phosphate regulon response regulator PhoB